MSPKQTDQVQEREPVAVRLAKNPFITNLVLVAAITLAFWPVVHADFINYDDTDYVTANPQVQAGLTWSNTTWAFVTRHASNWHPLTWLSHMLDVELFGKGPAGPHVINLVLHVLNSILLFGLLRRMTRAYWRSYVVAGLFALHPLHVESVAWVAERKDVLSTFFGLLTLLAYARYVIESNAPSRGSKGFYTLAVVWFALSLMSKPMLVTLPFVMLLLDFWPLRRFDLFGCRRVPKHIVSLIAEKSPFLLLSVISCVATTWAQEKAIQSLEHLPFASRAENVVVSYERYLANTIWPVNLALPYLHPGQWPKAQILFSAILIAGLCLIACLNLKRNPFIFTGWFWFLGTLVPVIGLVQVGAQAMADRYTYVPLIGVLLVLVWGAGEWCVRWRLPNMIIVASVLAMLGVCGSLSHRQAGYWRDSETLFKHAASATKNNFVALGNVGGVFFERGQLDEAMDFYQRSHQANPRYPEALNSIGAVLAAKDNEEAVEWFRKVLAVQPTHADALFNMGNAMAKKGQAATAVEYFQESVKIKPDNYEARNNLGNMLTKLGRLDEAIAQYQLALDNKPDAVMIRKNLAEMLAAKGKLDEAVLHYRKVLSLTNDAGTHYSLGLTFAVQGKWDGAIEQYLSTLRLSSTNAEARYNLGYAYKVQGRLDLAAAQLAEALRLHPNFPLAHYNLGCVLADLGQRDQAITHLQEAMRYKPDYTEAKEKLKTLEWLTNP